ncbi:unnamed protein product [Effrenium voratum]|nr:unnamed protein product [Effrenium voratum]
MGWLNATVFANMKAMLVTLEVSHDAMGWLKEAPSNMRFMVVTREVCHELRGWLKVVPKNMLCMSVTLETSHLCMSSLKVLRFRIKEIMSVIWHPSHRFLRTLV